MEIDPQTLPPRYTLEVLVCVDVSGARDKEAVGGVGSRSEPILGGDGRTGYGELDSVSLLGNCREREGGRG